MICFRRNINFLHHCKLDFCEDYKFHRGSCLGCLTCSYGTEVVTNVNFSAIGGIIQFQFSPPLSVRRRGPKSKMELDDLITTSGVKCVDVCNGVNNYN